MKIRPRVVLLEDTISHYSFPTEAAFNFVIELRYTHFKRSDEQFHYRLPRWYSLSHPDHGNWNV